MRTGSGMAGLAEKVCLGASSLAMVAFSGPHDIVILFRILAGGWGADATDGRTLGDEILNRVVLAAALFPALWLAGRASARMMGRRMPAEKGRLARLDAISWLPFVLLFAPFFPLWGARDLDGFLPPMLHLFLGVAACVLGGKASLWAVARKN